MRLVKFAERNRENAPWNATWIVHAPWAHPLWSDYAVLLYDLSIPVDDEPLHIYLEGATHEVLVFAINSRQRIDWSRDDWPVQDPDLLREANHAYQFIAGSNDIARFRIDSVVALIADQQISPDTDFAATWDQLFEDGRSLRESGFLPMRRP